MKKHTSGMNRRQALKTLLAGSATGAAIAIAGTAKAAESKDVTQAEKGEGYQETDHIRAYYASLKQQ